MRLESLQLLDVRNYERLDLNLTSGVTTFTGPNAQGKTNLLEAVHFLALGRSHRVSSDAALIRMGAEAAVIRAEARTDNEQRIAVSVELRQGRNRAQLNGQPQQRMADVYGQIRSVMLAPEDLTLVRGDPGDRRRFLDDLLAGRRATFAGARSDLDRALTQRNAVLKDARITGRLARDVLEVWTDTYVNVAATVLAARIAAVNALAEPLREAYADLVAASPAHDVDRLPVVAYELSWGRRVEGEAGQPVPDPAELAGELREALRCRYRETVALLADAGYVDEIPGRTTGEYLAAASEALPAATDAFGRLTLAFEKAWYGRRAVDAEGYAAAEAAQREVIDAGPLRRAVTIRDAVAAGAGS